MHSLGSMQNNPFAKSSIINDTKYLRNEVKSSVLLQVIYYEVLSTVD